MDRRQANRLAKIAAVLMIAILVLSMFAVFLVP